MRTPTGNYRAVRSKTIALTGGLNEETNNLEMKPGELFECINYEEKDGSAHGYRSTNGFERWDGTRSLIEYPKGSGIYLDVTYPSDVPVTKDSLGGVITGDTEVTSELVVSEGDLQITTEDYNVLGEESVKNPEFILGSSFWLKGSEDVNNTVTITTDGAHFQGNGDTALFMYPSSNELVSGFEYEFTVTIGSLDTGGLKLVAGGAAHELTSEGTHIWREVVSAATFYIYRNTAGLPIDAVVTQVSAKEVTAVVIPPEEVVTESYTIDNKERTTRRDQILPVPGVGPVLYCGYYGNQVYAIREGGTLEAPSGYAKLYLMAEGTDPIADKGGWLEVTEWPSDIPVNDPLVNPYRTSDCQLSYWPPSDPNTESLAFAQGLSPAIMLHRDSSGNHTVTKVLDPNLPTENQPTIPLYFENRLYLADANGHLFFSELGTITFDPVFYAGEIYFGWPIHDMVVSPGSAIVVWTEKGIKILNKITEADSVLTPVSVETFSPISSSIPMTAQRFLGTMIFSDDRGVTLLEASDVFGDFKAASLSKRVHRTFEANRNNILSASIYRATNQYKVLFKNGDGLVFTFDSEKKVKGTTYINTNHPMTYASSGKDSEDKDQSISGDEEGYVMFWRKDAQSFDGNPINTRLSTAYHHYGTVTHYKQFKKVAIEITSERGTPFSVRCDYDYKSPLSPKGATQYPQSEGASTGALWGEEFWGSFQWSGTIVEVASLYLAGWGVNMSLVIATSSSSHDPHTVHNFTASYSIGSIRQ